MFNLLGRSAPVIEIPQARHHVMLDQPLAFVAALRALDVTRTIPRPHGKSQAARSRRPSRVEAA